MPDLIGARQAARTGNTTQNRNLFCGGCGSPRAEALTIALRSAKTKAARREAIATFVGQAAATEVRAAQEARFVRWLAESGQGWASRAASEGTATAGGDLVPTTFNGALIRQMREYDGLLSAFELWESDNGAAANRAVGVPQSAGTAQTENNAIVDGPYFTLSNQAWGQSPTYGASARISNQLVQDAFTAAAPGSTPGAQSLDALVASLLGESLGRVIAPVASAALYTMLNGVGVSSGQNGGYIQLAAATPVSFITGAATTELAANTINIDTALQMAAAIDVAYLSNAKYYFTSTQWANLARQVDSSKHLQIDPAMGLRLGDYPVVLTSQTSAAVASTVSGVVFGDLEKAMTLRVAGGSEGLYLLRSTERYAEFLQTFYRAALRADVAARDSRAVVGVKYAAT